MYLSFINIYRSKGGRRFFIEGRSSETHSHPSLHEKHFFKFDWGVPKFRLYARNYINILNYEKKKQCTI